MKYGVRREIEEKGNEIFDLCMAEAIEI